MNRYDLQLTVPKTADVNALIDRWLHRPDDEGKPMDRSLAKAACCLFWEGTCDGGLELRRALTNAKIPYVGELFGTVDQAGSFLASANGAEASILCADGEIVVVVDETTGKPQPGSLRRAKAFIAKRRDAIAAIRAYRRT
jgi:hypothetical protein